MCLFRVVFSVNESGSGTLLSAHYGESPLAPPGAPGASPCPAPRPPDVKCLSHKPGFQRREATLDHTDSHSAKPHTSVDMSAPCMCSHNFIPWRGKTGSPAIRSHWWVASLSLSSISPLPLSPSFLSLREWMKDGARARLRAGCGWRMMKHLEQMSSRSGARTYGDWCEGSLCATSGEILWNYLCLFSIIIIIYRHPHPPTPSSWVIASDSRADGELPRVMALSIRHVLAL